MTNFNEIIADAKFETAHATNVILTTHMAALPLRKHLDMNARLLGALCNFVTPEVMAHCIETAYTAAGFESEMERARR